MERTYSIVTKASPEAAYDYVADITRHPEWSPDNMKMEPVAAGPVGVGSQFKAVGNLVGRPNASTLQVIALDKPRRFSFKAVDGNSEWIHEFLFSEVPEGTRIDRHVTAVRTPPGFGILFTLLEPFVVRPGNNKSMGMLRDRLDQLA